ncbi:hypothetical protein ACFE04_018018 [Oxalis oulophora]
MSMIWSSECYDFYVGGKEGWVSKPKESYNHWAGRMRFQVNDTLVFKLRNGSDSVLVVSREDYDSCNTKNSSLTLTNGHSTFKFDHSGPFYFITDNPNNCNQGQKLIVVVMAVRHKKQPPPTASPSPSSHPPASSPVATPSTSPASSPVATPSTSPASSPISTPSTSPLPPASSPGGSTPSGSPSNSGKTPAAAPAKSGSVVVGYSAGMVLLSVAMSVVLFGMV